MTIPTILAFTGIEKGSGPCGHPATFHPSKFHPNLAIMSYDCHVRRLLGKEVR
jgi:hypothetical protein